MAVRLGVGGGVRGWAEYSCVQANNQVSPNTAKPNTQPNPTPNFPPALRANPFPEVTDPFCRLPLSTLFYRLEAVHLGDLMRLWVRPGKDVEK